MVSVTVQTENMGHSFDADRFEVDLAGNLYIAKGTSTTAVFAPGQWTSAFIDYAGE